jgi:hypothetical protein
MLERISNILLTDLHIGDITQSYPEGKMYFAKMTSLVVQSLPD